MILGSKCPNDHALEGFAIASCVSDASDVLHRRVHIEDLSPRLPGPCFGQWERVLKRHWNLHHLWGWTTETPMEDLPSLLMSANNAATCPLLSGQNRNKTLPECRNDAKVESQSLTSSPGRIFWLDKQDVMKRLQHASSMKREPHPCDSLDFPPTPLEWFFVDPVKLQSM